MKKTRYSRMMLLGMALIMLLVVAACSGGTEPSSGEGNGETSQSNSSADGSKGKEAAPKGDPVTLRIELFDRGNTPPGAPPLTESYFVDYIQENFGDPNNIKLEFVTVPRSEEVAQLNVLLAANEAPDLIFSYSLEAAQNWARQGGLTDFAPLLDEHGPQLKAYLADTLPYGVINDEQVLIPGKRIIRAISTPFIRKDWLDQLGLPLPQTTEELYEALRAFKEHDPGQTGGKVVPFGIKYNFNINPVVMSFWEPMSEEDFNTMPDWIKPGNKEGYRFLNKMYNEGLISPDFALDRDGKKFQADIVNGLTGFAIANTNEPVYMGYINILYNNVPDAELVPIDPFTNSEGKRPKHIYNPYAAFMMVPKSSERAVEVVKFLDWMVAPEVRMVLQNGIEGVTYELDEEGIPYILQTEEANNIMYNWTDYSVMINGKDMDDLEMTMKANAAIPEFREFTVQSFEIGSNDGVVPFLPDRPLESAIKYKATLDEKGLEIHVKSITVSPEEFDRTYDDLVAEYMHIGGQEVMEETLKAYREMNP